MRPRGTVALALAIAVLAALPSVAGAAVTIGSNLTSTQGTNGPGQCITACTAVNTFLPPSHQVLAGLTAPMDGVVVRWRVNSGSNSGPVAPRVLRPAGTNTFTGAGTGEGVMVDTGQNQFDTRLPIRKGDSIGLDIQNSALVFADTTGANGVAWLNGLPDNQTIAGNPSTNKELVVQAVIEPDADGDGFGDETQDGCPGDKNRQTPPCGSGTTNPGGNPPPPAGDTTPPVLSALRVTPRSLRIGKRATISFRLSEISRVRLAFAKLVPGRRRGTRCVRQTIRVRTGRRCTAALPEGSLTLRAQGTQSIVFRGRIGRRALLPGRYRITATARDLAGNAMVRPVTTTFTLLPRARRGR